MSKRISVFVFTLGLALLLAAGPMAGAQEEAQIDLIDFIPEMFRGDFVDLNGDGIPDLGQLPPEGVAGIWDDKVGAVTDEEFLTAVSSLNFDVADEGSHLLGACKGVAISYDADGLSVDAIVSRGGGEPPLDIFGNQKMTRSNPFLVDTRGVLVYFGSSQPETFFDHRWYLMAEGVFKDTGGDPNPQGKNRNAGSVDFGNLLPFPFTALVKAQGAWVANWGAAELPVQDSFAQQPNCVGAGWVKFVGPNPFLTPPGALAAVLAAVGFTGVLFNARPALSWRE
jgi:hypothetical protein